MSKRKVLEKSRKANSIKKGFQENPSLHLEYKKEVRRKFRNS